MLLVQSKPQEQLRMWQRLGTWDIQRTSKKSSVIKINWSTGNYPSSASWHPDKALRQALTRTITASFFFFLAQSIIFPCLHLPVPATAASYLEANLWRFNLRHGLCLKSSSVLRRSFSCYIKPTAQSTESIFGYCDTCRSALWKWPVYQDRNINWIRLMTFSQVSF